MAEKIKDNLYWLGMDNPDSRDFHGIYTPRGGSYNSYLILDDKPTIVDLTNTPFLKSYLESLRSVIDPKEIQYIVINHTEPDHCGAIKEILKHTINAKVVCTEKCREFLEAQFDIKARFQTVKQDEALGLGKCALRFYPMPMVHWPEAMMTFMEDGKVLFSSDLFGTEIAHESLYADDMKDFRSLTKDYFAIVMRPFFKQVQKAADTAITLSPGLICPSHGPIYRNKEIIGLYEKLAKDPEEDKFTIIYYSIWHGTEKIAKQIKEALKKEDKKVEFFDIERSNLVHMMASCLTSKYLIIGSMTIASSYHPSFDALFSLLKLNHQKDKICGIFGTHGWSSGSVPRLKEKLEQMEYRPIAEVDCRFGKVSEENIEEFKRKILASS